MKNFTKALAAIMLMTAVVFSTGCKPEAEPVNNTEINGGGNDNGGDDNGGGNNGNVIDGHDYVDLGLPSGILWATCNVSADTPEGYGCQLFEDETGMYYTWVGWKLPLKEDWDELFQNTTNAWVTQNGINGRRFTAKNGKSIFLPAAGNGHQIWENDVHVGSEEEGVTGYYWSRTRDYEHYSIDPGDSVWTLYFDSETCELIIQPIPSDHNFRFIHPAI